MNVSLPAKGKSQLDVLDSNRLIHLLVSIINEESECVLDPIS